MGENLHDIDKLFKDGIDPYEEAPTPALWDSIEKNLDKEDTDRLRRHNRLLRRGSLVLLVFLGISVYFLIQYKQPHQPSGISKAPENENPVRLPDTALSNNETTTVTTTPPSNKPATGINQTGNDKDENPIEVKPEDPLQPVSTDHNKKTVKKDSHKESDKLQPSSATPARVDDIASNSLKEEKRARSSIALEQTEKKKNSLKRKRVSKPTKADPSSKDWIVSENSNQSKIRQDVAARKNITSDPIRPHRDNKHVPEAARAGITDNSEEAAYVAKEVRLVDLTQQSAILPSGQLNDFSNRSVSAASIGAKKKPTVVHLPEHKSFGVSVYYSPNINLLHVEAGERKHMEDDKDAIREGERVKSSNSFGITGSYSFNSNWAVQVGLSVFKQTSIIQPKNLFARHDDRRGNLPGSGDIRYKFNCAAGYVFLDPKSGTPPAFGDSATALESENTLSYTSIPVTVQYSRLLGKFRLNAVAGVGINLLSKAVLQSNYITSPGSTKTQSVDPVQGLKSMYLSGILGAGLEYSISSRLSTYVLPNLNFSISPINKNTPALTRLNNLGFQTGVKFRL